MAQKRKWTAAARSAFIARLAECGEVRRALATVGLSPKSAYRLRAKDVAFARAWDTALLHSRHVVVAELTSRALNGWKEDVWFRGEKVGTRTRHDSRLLLALVARLDAVAGMADQPEHARRAAPHFAEMLSAIRHKQPLDPLFIPPLAERQNEAIRTVQQELAFDRFKPLMTPEYIDAIYGFGDGQDEDDEDRDGDDLDEDDLDEDDLEDGELGDQLPHDRASDHPAAIDRTATAESLGDWCEQAAAAPSGQSDHQPADPSADELADLPAYLPADVPANWRDTAACTTAAPTDDSVNATADQAHPESLAQDELSLPRGCYPVLPLPPQALIVAVADDTPDAPLPPSWPDPIRHPP